MNLFIGTSSYDNTVTVPYMKSMLEFMINCRSKNIEYTHYISNIKGLTESRQDCIDKFLQESKYTHFLSIDSDIGFNSQDVFDLINADKDIIGGICPKKQLNIDKINELPIDTIEVDTIGTGFVLIKRHVIEKIGLNFDSWNGKMHVLTSIKLSHVGRLKYEGSFKSILKIAK